MPNPDPFDLPDNVEIHPSAFVAPNATVLGDVSVGAYASIWFGAVIRGEVASVTIGDRTNVQDGAIVHVDVGFPVSIGANVTVGHRAVVHGATIEDHCIVGIGAILLNGCHIGH